MGKGNFGIKALISFVVMCCFGIAIANNANAAVMSADSINKLGVMRGVRQCYANAVPSIKKIEFNGPETVFKDKRTSEGGKDAVEMPTNVGNNLDYNHFILKCKKITGDDKAGFQKYYAFPDTLEGLGYELNSADNSGGSNGDEAFVAITLISHNYGSDTNDTKIIVPENESRILCHGKRESAGWGGTKYRWVVDYCDGTITAEYNNAILLQVGTETINGSRDGFPVWTDDGDVSSHLRTRFASDANDINEYLGNMLMDGLDTMENDKRKDENFSLLTAINDSSFFSNLQNYFIESAIPKYGANPGLELVLTQTNKESTDTENEYRLIENNYWVAADKMLSTVGIDESLPTSSYEMGGVTYRHYYWSNAARYSLYYYYLLNKMEQYPNDITIGHCSSTKPNKYAFKNKSNEWCKINIEYGVQGEVLSKQDYNMVSILVDGQLDLVQGYFVDVLEWFDDEASYSNLAESQYADVTISNDGGVVPSDSGTSTSNSGNQCWESNIDSMAWVMCPIESNLKTFASKFTGLIDSWLQVDTDLYKTGGGAHIAWGYIRTIANTIMIIFMGVIIFSQLTGYGIDNYGIKKLLPKFILMAVVINLSFFLCQIIIDLSNILGNGIQGLLYGVGNQILAANGGDAALMNNFIDAVTATIYTASTLGPTALTAGVTIAATAGSGGTILGVMLVLLMLVTVVAAIIMFFVSLGARMVIIMVCLIMAPLALACYILPNTKDTFKKWKDAFKAAIIIYPICGFTIGVSYIIKAIALGPSMPFLMIVVSGIVPFLPFFMIPAMLKGAISTLGAAGNALSTMGNTFKSGAGKLAGGTSDMIKNSDRYKIASRLRAEMNTRKRAGIDESGQPTARGKRRIARSLKRPSEARLEAARIAAAKKSVETNEEANSALTNAYAKFGIAEKGGDAVAYYGSQLDAALSKKDKEESLTAINSVLAAASSSGYLQDKQVAKILRDRQQAMETKFGKGSETLSTWMRDTNTKYGKGFLATDFEMKHWMQNGGKGGVEALGKNYGDYTRNVLKAPGSDAWTDYKAEDGARLSSDSLLGMAREGIINTSMAASMLDMHKNYSPDKKVMLNAIMNGATVADTQAFKQDVMNALKTDGSGNYVGGTIGGVAFTGEQIKEWTAARPQDVNVVNGPTEISIPHGPYGGALAGSPRNPNPNPNSSKTEFKRTEKFE